MITVVGCVPCAAPGERLVASGVWEQHPQHGEQLRASELERTLPEDEDEILSYLASGVCTGVGPATAQRLVDLFGGTPWTFWSGNRSGSPPSGALPPRRPGRSPKASANTWACGG